MAKCFVNLPIRYIAEDRSYLEFFLEKKINPELGLDAISLDRLDKSWHQELASILEKEGSVHSIHLPFHDLQPGSIDDLVLKATRDRLQKSIQIASLYKPKFMIAHDYFIPLYNDFYPKWLNRATQTWKQILDAWPDSKRPPLYLENVREQDPGPISDLISEMSDLNVKFCLDLGHWFSYGCGSQYENLSIWLQTMSPFLAHLHLHDNEGVEDEHLGLGQGNIPWFELFSDLDFLELTPSFTLEPHNLEDLEKSCRFIQKHFSWFYRLGIRKSDFPFNF